MAYCGPHGIPLSEFLSWDPDDQAAALGWMHEESHRCSKCGTSAWEWEEDPNAYEPISQVCLGCNLLGQEEKGNAAAAAAFPGLKTYLQRVSEEAA